MEGDKPKKEKKKDLSGLFGKKSKKSKKKKKVKAVSMDALGGDSRKSKTKSTDAEQRSAGANASASKGWEEENDMAPSIGLLASRVTVKTVTKEAAATAGDDDDEEALDQRMAVQNARAALHQARRRKMEAASQPEKKPEAKPATGVYDPTALFGKAPLPRASDKSRYQPPGLASKRPTGPAFPTLGGGAPKAVVAAAGWDRLAIEEVHVPPMPQWLRVGAAELVAGTGEPLDAEALRKAAVKIGNALSFSGNFETAARGIAALRPAEGPEARWVAFEELLMLSADQEWSDTERKFIGPALLCLLAPEEYPAQRAAVAEWRQEREDAGQASHAARADHYLERRPELPQFVVGVSAVSWEGAVRSVESAMPRLRDLFLDAPDAYKLVARALRHVHAYRAFKRSELPEEVADAMELPAEDADSEDEFKEPEAAAEEEEEEEEAKPSAPEAVVAPEAAPAAAGGGGSGSRAGDAVPAAAAAAAGEPAAEAAGDAAAADEGEAMASLLAGSKKKKKKKKKGGLTVEALAESMPDVPTPTEIAPPVPTEQEQAALSALMGGSKKKKKKKKKGGMTVEALAAAEE